MSEFLIIHYKPGHESNLQYWAMGADNHPSITLGHGNLEELTAIARGKKVSVLIDAHYTRLDSVNIPSKSRSKQLLAVPFAMEDNLAEDIEDMHFALGKAHTEKSATEKTNTIPVIAIKRSLLQQTINTFNEQQIHLEIVSADSVALPGSSNNWSILLDEDSALIKTGDSQAHSCDRDNLSIILQSLLQSLSEKEQNAPETISYYYKEDDTEAESLLSECEIKIEPHCYKNHALEIFVQNLNAIPSFNLLQGEFTPVHEGNAWLKPWKSAAIAASVFLILQLGNSTMLASQLEQKNLKLTRQIEAEFKRAIPDSRNMTNMKIRVERRLNELKGGGSDTNKNGFLQILSRVSSTLSKNSKIDIQAAVFRNNYIDVDLTAKSLQDIENIKNKLAAIPGIKTVLSTTVEKDSIKGRLRLESKG